ncbi:amino acid/polyamine transporter I [Pyrenochaeta sp. MPI-SDFR-AT-0127]|nr:amino acid/polyamine transporter I [Pyrenochaeta sp. MPI-SDFR-AT-0127]
MAGKQELIELGEIPTRDTANQDEAALARLGKKSVLKRKFGFLSILGFSCTVLVTWEGFLILFLVGLQNGGPAGVFYGYLTAWLGTTSVFAVLSELVSMAPTSGGQYHWVAMLAPQRYQKVLSYISGWLTVAGWQATLASSAYLTGSLIQGLLILTQPNYVPQNWHATLLFWAIITFGVIITTGASWLLPKFEGMILIIHILGFFGIMIPLLTLGPREDAHDVFTTFINKGGWDSQGLSFCIGMMGTVYAFMAEEIQNAPVIVPRAIMTGILINGSLGFGMMLTMLFRSGDIDAALEANPSFPFIAIFHNAVQSVSGAAAMASLVMILSTCCAVGTLASSSRVFWAFSRDRGLPGWRTLSQVSPRTSLPVNAVAATTVVACILSFVNIGSATAFNGVISVAIAGIFCSYLLVASLLLYRRTTGGIISLNASTNEFGLTNTTGKTLSWGPWRIPGVLGIANNLFACAYLSFVFFFTFWPSVKNVTPATMNWSILVTGFITIFSAVYYMLHARKTYNGPIIEVDEE